jgi:membrane protein DedA with SNARE-associated domain
MWYVLSRVEWFLTSKRRSERKMVLSFDQIVGLLSNNAYLVLLPLSIVEGPIVTLASGFLISIGQLNPLFAYGVVVAGDLIGDAILYSLGRWGGDRVLSAWRKNSRTAARVRNVKDQLLSKADRVLIVGKLTHTIGAPVLFAAGMVRMPFARFMMVNLGATLLKSFILIVAGYWIGSSYRAIIGNSLFLSGALLLLGVGGLSILLFRRRAKGPANAARRDCTQHQSDGRLSLQETDVVASNVTSLGPNSCEQAPRKSAAGSQSEPSLPSARTS